MSKADRWNAEVAFARIAELEDRIHELEASARQVADKAIGRITELEAALRAPKRLFDEALPKFDWGRSALDANAITLLNEVPSLVNATLAGFQSDADGEAK